MDTYTIFKAAKDMFIRLLREQNPDKDNYWLESEANIWADNVVEQAIKMGMFYPFSEINKRKETYYPVMNIGMY